MKSAAMPELNAVMIHKKRMINSFNKKFAGCHQQAEVLRPAV